MKPNITIAKYLIAASGLVVAGAGLFLMTRDATRPAKYYLVERETLVRPARFEDLKFKLEPAVEMRAPASEEH